MKTVSLKKRLNFGNGNNDRPCLFIKGSTGVFHLIDRKPQSSKSENKKTTTNKTTLFDHCLVRRILSISLSLWYTLEISAITVGYLWMFCLLQEEGGWHGVWREWEEVSPSSTSLPWHDWKQSVSLTNCPSMLSIWFCS